MESTNTQKIVRLYEAMDKLDIPYRSLVRHFDSKGLRDRDLDAFFANCVGNVPTETGDFRGFIVHGVVMIANAINFEIEVSPDREAIRARRTLHDGVIEVTDWLDIDVELEEKDIPLIDEDCPCCIALAEDGVKMTEHRPIVRNVFGFDIYLDEIEYVPEHYEFCETCKANRLVKGGGDFNDCPSEGGEEWGQTVYYSDLACGHRVYETEISEEAHIGQD